MVRRQYQIAIAAAAFVATALLLAVQPLSLSAGRVVDVELVKNTAVPGDVVEGSLEREPLDYVTTYRQAIEDVLPLMKSLQARRDTVQLAQLARSVLEVWNELASIDPEAVPDEALREVIEDWAGRDRALSGRQESAER